MVDAISKLEIKFKTFRRFRTNRGFFKLPEHEQVTRLNHQYRQFQENIQTEKGTKIRTGLQYALSQASTKVRKKLTFTEGDLEKFPGEQ